jgi:tetratricopeptide (TPR) repeat protein
VAYIAGRADPVYLLFALLSLICFIVYQKAGKRLLIYYISLVSFVLALLSKEMAIIMPFLLLFCIFTLTDREQEERKKLAKGTIPYFLILIIYVVLRVTVVDFSQTVYTGLVLQPTPFYVRALTACKAIFMYFRFLLFPVGFQLETHLAKSKSLLEGATLAAITGTIFLIFILLYIRKRDKPMFFGLAWFFLGLLPVLNLFPVNAAIAVHWLYLPSIGFFFAVSLIFWRFLEVSLPGFRPEKKTRLFVLIVILAGMLLGTLTYQKNKEWRNEETLYKSILPFSQTPRVYVNLGNIYARKGEFDKAIPCYQKALQIAPGQTEAYVNLGYIYIAKREYKKAEDILEKAIKISPRHTNAHYNLGVVYASTGRHKEALSEINKTIELNPNHIAALNTMGKIYLRQGKRSKAKEAFERSISIKPEQPRIKEILRKIK